MKKLIKKIPRAADQVTILYQLLMIVLIIFHFNSIQYNIYFIIYHLLLVTFLLWLADAPENPILNWIKLWNPIILIPINFSELHYLVHPVNPFDFDKALIDLDYVLFGVHPTVWMERILNPFFTEYLQIIYTTFYFLPILLVYLLYKRQADKEFDYFVFIVVFGFYLSYIGYFLVPAVGPRFTIDYLQTTPLTGLWLTESIRHTLDTLENIQRDAFPSGHTEITVLTMYYAYFYSKRYFYVLLIIGTSLVFSTVYLRYHYVVDVFAGLILAGIVVIISPTVYKILNDFKLNYLKNKK